MQVSVGGPSFLPQKGRGEGEEGEEGEEGKGEGGRRGRGGGGGGCRATV